MPELNGKGKDFVNKHRKPSFKSCFFEKNSFFLKKGGVGMHSIKWREIGDIYKKQEGGFR